MRHVGASPGSLVSPCVNDCSSRVRSDSDATQPDLRRHRVSDDLCEESFAFRSGDRFLHWEADQRRSECASVRVLLFRPLQGITHTAIQPSRDRHEASPAHRQEQCDLCPSSRGVDGG